MANVIPQLDFGSALSLALKRIKETEGRSRRSEFWWTMLALVLVNIVLSFIPVAGPILSICVWLAAAPLMIRRLHDAGYGPVLVYIYLGLSVIMQILSLIAYFKIKNATTWSDVSAAGSLATISLIVTVVDAIIGIILIVFWCQDSQPFVNQYGPSPKYPDGMPGMGPQQPFGARPYGQQQYGQQQQYEPQQQYGPQQYGPQQPQQQYGPQQPNNPQTQYKP